MAVDIGALQVSDEYTFKHSVDVATMAMIVARKYGLNDNQVYQIGIAGLLHDIGKSKIPNEILNKAGKLTDDEFTIMKMHSTYGYHIDVYKRQSSTFLSVFLWEPMCWPPDIMQQGSRRKCQKQYTQRCCLP